MKNLTITRIITNREDSITTYYKIVNKYKVLSIKEENLLHLRIKNGDKIAFDELLLHNLKFVISVAKQYQNNSGCQLMDLISEGNLGLIEAAKRFDTSKNVKFISYAVWWIRQSILIYIMNNKTIRIPTNRVQELRIVGKKIDILSKKFNYAMSSYDAIDNLSSKEIDKKTIYKSINANNSTRSLNEKINDDDSFCLIDIIKSEQPTNSDLKDLKVIINIMLNKLKCSGKRKRGLNEKEVIIKYFGLNDSKRMTLNEIGLEYGVTREYIRLIVKKSIEQMKNKYIKNVYLKEYFNDI